MTRRRLAAALVGLAIACPGQAPRAEATLREFRNRALTFRIDLPATWRQLAPNEARQIGDNHPMAPAELCLAQPDRFYAVGPVDEWLAGRFTSPWVYVVEQDEEWYVPDDFATLLAEKWQKEGA